MDHTGTVGGSAPSPGNSPMSSTETLQADIVGASRGQSDGTLRRPPITAPSPARRDPSGEPPGTPPAGPARRALRVRIFQRPRAFRGKEGTRLRPDRQGAGNAGNRGRADGGGPGRAKVAVEHDGFAGTWPGHRLNTE